jgi:hypothetical protein
VEWLALSRIETGVVMIRQLKHSRVLHALWPSEMHLAYAGDGQGAAAPRRPVAASTTAQLPRRPDASALSEAIPLFYIGRNKNGIWVVREAEGRSGGLFFLKQSAVRFARRQSEPAGCAMMFLDGPIELDIADQGSRHVTPVSATEKAARHAPSVAAVARSVVTAWRKLVARVSCSLASGRRNRAAIEKELFGGQYRLCSKNDDDLPIP